MSNRHLARTIAMQTLFVWDFNGKKTELEIIKAGLITKSPAKPKPGSPPAPPPGSGTIKTNLPAKKMKVKDYKTWLTKELQKLSGANENDDVEFSN